MDSTVLAEALESLRFGKGRLGSLGSEVAPLAPVCSRDPAEWAFGCLSLILSSGVWGEGETSRSEAVRTRMEGPLLVVTG